MDKINYDLEFAGSIANYQVLPYWAVNFTAVTLPWAELILGLMLVVGFRAKAATVMLGVLMFMLTLVLVINVI